MGDVSSIPKEQYRRFLDNDKQLAEMYGKSMQLFRKNKADIDFDRSDYDLVKLHETIENSESGEQILVTINNPYGLKIRPEKQIAMVSGLPRSQVKSLLKKGSGINSCRLHMNEYTEIRFVKMDADGSTEYFLSHYNAKIYFASALHPFFLLFILIKLYDQRDWP